MDEASGSRVEDLLGDILTPEEIADPKEAARRIRWALQVIQKVRPDLIRPGKSDRRKNNGSDFN